MLEDAAKQFDETGRVGRSYGAKNTPHVFVINAKGILVYAGAVDNSPDGELEAPTDGSLVRHLENAVEETLAGKAVSVPKAEPWGCAVHYGK